MSRAATLDTLNDTEMGIVNSHVGLEIEQSDVMQRLKNLPPAMKRAEAMKHPIMQQVKELTKEKGVIVNLLVTPEIAEVFRAMSDKQRPGKPRSVKQFVELMSADKWDQNGDTFKFDWDYSFRDGQHRNLAVILSGKAQIWDIKCGLDPKVFRSMDSGVKRTPGDVLAVEGYDFYNILAAAIKQDIYFREQQRSGGMVDSRSSKRVANTDISTWKEERGNDIKLMSKCVRYGAEVLHKHGKFVSQHTWAFIYYTLAKRHHAMATDFVNMLSTGDNISRTKNSVIFLLREKLINFRIKGNTWGGRRDPTLKLNYIFTAWNTYRDPRKRGVAELEVDKKLTKIIKPL
jgi:hypothetical protein